MLSLGNRKASLTLAIHKLVKDPVFPFGEPLRGINIELSTVMDWAARGQYC